MSLVDYIKLTRPPLLFLGFLACYSLMVYYGNWGGLKGWLILFAIGLGNAAFNIFNEIVDIEQDRINKPYKPLPSGRVSLNKAIALGFLLFVASVFFASILAVFYDRNYALLSVFGYVLGGAYNIAQARGIFGNIALGGTYGIAAFMSSYPHGQIFALSFAATTIAFNIAVQVQDYEADKKAGVVTVPVQLSIKCARAISVMFALISLLFLEVLYVTMELHYIAVMCFVVINLFIIFAVLLNKEMLYELYLRILARAFMIVGFVCILLRL